MSSARFAVSLRWRLRLLLAVVLAGALIGGLAAAAAQASPKFTGAPYVYEHLGHLRVGEELECDPGSWSDTASWSYEWVREGVAFLSGPSYVLAKSDEHKEIWCVVTAYEGANQTGGASPPTESDNSVCFGPPCNVKPPVAPEVKEPNGQPEISGTAEVGRQLTCSQGEWSGEPTPTYAYSWLRDKKETISGATANTYTVTKADETHTLSCRVTASNAGGSKSAESKKSIAIPGSAPKIETEHPPEVDAPGGLAVGQELACFKGGWTGTSPVYEYRWLLNGSEIPMATGPTFIVEPADEGQQLACKVIATNAVPPKGEATSAAVTIESKLVSTRAPEITGVLEQGHTLACSTGEWSQTGLSYKYKWIREKTTIGGATYTVKSEDRVLYCEVEASKASERASALSAPVSIYKGAGFPVNTKPPEVTSALFAVGHTITCTTGSWTNSPTSYIYQWLREGTAIPGAETSTYTIEAADEGQKLACQVIAENAEGASVAAESEAERIKGTAPSNTVAPQVHGASSPRVGETLTCSRGTWTGAPEPSFAYEWLREGSEEVGEGPSYLIGERDRGHSLSCRVTASNIEASVPATSANSVSIAGIAPTPPLSGPTVTGTPAIEATLTCVAGTWSGVPAPTFTYQWLSDGTAITAASPTGKNFTVTGANAGHVLSCKVTGTNTEGSESATSTGLRVKGAAPAPIELPSISGGGAVGEQMTCNPGQWSGRPYYSYEWLRNGAPISGAGESTYTLELADQGQRIACNVTATNFEGSSSEESANVVLVKARSTVPKYEVPITGGGKPKVVVPPAGVILASINRQLAAALTGLKLAKVRRAGKLSFTFIPPTAGTFSLFWYETVKGAHGARSKQVVLAQATDSFKSSLKVTITLRLTAAGRHALKHHHRLSLLAKGIFTVPGRVVPITWSMDFRLKR